MTTYKTKCVRCQDVKVHSNTTLDAARLHVCPHCHIRTVVVGHEVEDRTPVNYEVCGISGDDHETARRLIIAAFGE